MYLCKSLNRKRLAVSQDTIEMKDYKEILSTFDGKYYKNLLGDIHEKVERYNEIGQVCRVSLRWRGKYYHLQLFFPGSKFPSRKEVEVQVHKVYPDATVMVHYASESQPNQPLIRVAENKEERNPNTGLPDIKEVKSSNSSKGNVNDPDLRRLIPESEVLGEGEYDAKASMYQSGITDASRVKGPVGKAVDKVKNVFKKKEKGGEYRAKAAMYMSGYVPKGEVIDEAQSSYDKARKAAARRAANRNAERRAGTRGGNMERETYTSEAGARMHYKGYRARENEEVEVKGGVIEGIMQMVKRVGKKPEPKKHDYGRDAGNIARKKLEKKERETYVNDMSNSFGEESKYYKGNPKGTPKKPKAGDRRPGVKEEKNYVEFMKRVEKLPEVTRDSIKSLGDDPLVAKAALEISGLPK